ncbi:hypothetical protein DH96_02050 [Candidatus Phytoplasma oryzae]|uniref:Uncharacterized protein n=1 Tax=Candidatus Phytoplasma oryzae TaxID=203274 RepID=A0A328IIZ0_9MOLU|nr:hypothetical protein DH96_02050 [Candidatus Phytoplasma oryzae]
MFELFNYFINFCEFVLFIFTLPKIYKNFYKNHYYYFEKKYKICFLNDKSIKSNINYLEKKYFIHFFSTIETCLISITLYSFLLKLYMLFFWRQSFIFVLFSLYHLFFRSCYFFYFFI